MFNLLRKELYRNMICFVSKLSHWVDSTTVQLSQFNLATNSSSSSAVTCHPCPPWSPSWPLTGEGPISWEMMSMGTGKMMVLLCSAAMLFRVCRYLSWRWVGLDQLEHGSWKILLNIRFIKSDISLKCKMWKLKTPFGSSKSGSINYSYFTSVYKVFNVLCGL